jgi:hypothetical protein
MSIRMRPGREAKLSYAGHVVMENRHGFVVDTMVTPADGYAEIDAALVMLEALPARPGLTVGGDGRLVDWIFTFTAAAYNLVRLRTLLTASA